MNLTWRYGTGWYFGHFFRVLKEERRLLGLRCPVCRRVYLPPRPVCGNCHAELSEWVPVADTGTVRAFTVVHLPIVDPATGEPRPTPYGMALIQLDGASTTINHYLAETDLSKLRIGLRVQAVWREERQGRMSDIRHFEIITAQKAGSREQGAGEQSAVGLRPSAVVEEGVSLSFRYAAGKVASRFLVALRDEKRIYGTRCPECRRVLVPARSFCSRCGVDTDEWVEVSPEGTLTAFTTTRNPQSEIQNPKSEIRNPQSEIQNPRIYGLIRLDGADTDLVHRLGEAEPDVWRVGMRVEAVFAQERKGHILDIAYFRPKEASSHEQGD